MKELNGVRLGQRVRDADGKDLGRVTKLHAWGFEVLRGFPVLFRKDRVVRYDEVRGARDGALVVARSDHDLFDLAEGGVPRSWRVPAHTSLGQSKPSSFTHSSLTIRSPRSKSGSTVWQKPLKGGE